ncbi:hypothetical protein ACJX0J_021352, partial [Zea mays]
RFGDEIRGFVTTSLIYYSISLYAFRFERPAVLLILIQSLEPTRTKEAMYLMYIRTRTRSVNFEYQIMEKMYTFAFISFRLQVYLRRLSDLSWGTTLPILHAKGEAFKSAYIDLNKI